MRSVAALTALLLMLSGCAGDGGGKDGNDGDPGMDDLPEEPEDELCHADAADYTAIPPAGAEVLYYTDHNSGNWIYQESNNVAGLQYSEGHVSGCPGGDMIII